MIAVDNWRDSQASVMAAQEEGHAEALRRMEQQARGRQAPGTTLHELVEVLPVLGGTGVGQ